MVNWSVANTNNKKSTKSLQNSFALKKCYILFITNNYTYYAYHCNV